MPAQALLLAVILSLFIPGAHASSSEVEELRAIVLQLSGQVTDLQQRLQTLEHEDAKQTTEIASYQAHSQQSGWAEKLAFKGDFRYRYDRYDDQRDSQSRSRDRIRARAQITATLDERTLVGLGIASGDDDPISTNQTLGSATSTKDLRLDLAWFQWQAMDDLRWLGGKFKNPVHRVGDHFLVWDSDMRPEGMNLVYKTDKLHATVGYNHLESDNEEGRQDDVSFGVFQADYDWRLGEETSLLLGGGYYDIPTAGEMLVELGDSARNSVNDEGEYIYNYEEIEAFAELHTNIADMPLTLFVDYVHNLDADEQDTAYALGLRLGSIDKKGSWKLAYTWQETDADALLGILTDSDFADGGTDSRGHVFSGSYALTDVMNLSMTYFSTEYGKFTLGEYDDFDRIFIDLSFKY